MEEPPFTASQETHTETVLDGDDEFSEPDTVGEDEEEFPAKELKERPLPLFRMRYRCGGARCSTDGAPPT